MNYNLKKLLKGETIPELTNLIVEELKQYGVCQYVPYKDGTYILNLETTNDLTTAQLNSVKNIILNHNSLNFHKNEKIKKLKQKASEIIENKYPTFKQINAAIGVYEDAKKSEMVNYIKNIIAQVDALETIINSKIKLSTLEAVEIIINS